MRRRRLVLMLAGLGAAAVLAAALGIRLTARPAQDGPAIGGAFALTDGGGNRVTDASFAGLWRLVYFGYTHCPDACPTTLSNLAAGLDKLTPAARARLRVLFITVDPARDTPAVMGAYAQAFGPEFTGLTGSPAELQATEGAFHVYARRHELKGGDYAMDHSSIIYLMRPDGRFAGVLDDALAPAELARRLTDAGA